MWQSLMNYADSELEVSTEAVKLSFDKLDAAAKELQQRVKELLADYNEGDAGERGSMTASRSAGGDGGELGHAAGLLAHLCAQPPRAEEGTAPGTIFTPRGPQAGAIIPNEAGLSVVAGANKLNALLLADVPALRWDLTAGPGAAAGTGPILQQAYLRGGPSHRLAAKLNVTVDVDATALDDTLTALQDYSREIQAEACSELRELQTLDASPHHVYSHLLQQALGPGRVPGPDQLAWSWVPPQDDSVAKGRQLLLAVVHSSRSATDAWAALTDAFMHDMALPDVEAARMLGPRCSRGQSGSADLFVTLDSYRGLLTELERIGDQWLAQRLEAREVQPEGPAAGNRAEEVLAVIKSNLMPRTYLQMVGQKLLYHAAHQVPCMTQLPERIPDWTLRTLYGRPFAEAVKLALQAALTGSSTPNSCLAASSEEPAAGGKLLRALPRPREESRRQGGESSQQPASSGGCGVAAGLAGGDVAVSTVGISATGGTLAGKAEDAAVEHARAAVMSMAEVCRDLLAFEEGFSAILRSAAAVPTDQPGTAPPPPPPLHPHLQCDLPYTAAAAYLSAIRDEVLRAMREARPALQGAMCGNITSAVQACLSSGAYPPRPAAVTSDIWPASEVPVIDDVLIAQGPGGSGSNTGAPRLVDDASHRVLSFASWLHGRGRVDDLPGPLQVVLWGALLECLSALMDHLSSICTTLREMPAEPLPRLLLFRSAAACVRRRLEACATEVGRASLPLHHQDEPQLALVQQHGECLVQADELVSSIHQHILMACHDIVQSVVLSSLDRTDWCAFRPEVMRGANAGPGVRVWHCLMLRLLHAAVHHSSPHDAEWIVGQVLQDGLVSQTQRYLHLCPTAQMLREYVADAVHIVATVFLFCQPLKVRLPAASQADMCLRVPYPMVVALSATARELLMRAALLHVPGVTLVELARKVGLCAPTAGDAPSPSPSPSSSPWPSSLSAPTTAPSQPQPQPPAPALSSAASSLSPAPWPSLPVQPLESTPSASEAGSSLPLPGPVNPASRVSGAGGAIRLEPLPAIHVQRASWSTERRSVGPVGEGQIPAGSGRDPTNLQPPLLADASAVVSSAHDDDRRLALWSSWLPYAVVQSLKREAEGLDLGGAGCATQLMPLGDRMADPCSGGGGPASRLNPPADGHAWHLCLEHVARHHAGRQQVLLALARRQELHPALGTEAACDMESRRAVRQVACQLGLLLEQGPAGGGAD